MILDGRKLGDDAVLEADICLIGAGAAGISMALDLIDDNVSVLLLESGGLTSDGWTRSLNAGANIGLDYCDLDRARSRYFGGSTNCWGGWCRTLDEIDFEPRPWIPNSGWPIGRETLAPWYQRSRKWLELDEAELDLQAAVARIAKGGLTAFDLDDARIANIWAEFSPPTRFGSRYREALAKARQVRVVLYANATEIVPDPERRTIRSVRVQTMRGNGISVRAKHFVLAAGGIENARLLLASNRIDTSGVGNRHDTVGRYFMDHARIRSREVRLTDQKAHRGLYDATIANTRQLTGVSAGRLAAFVAPTPATQRALALPNARTYLIARYAHDMSDAYLALKGARRSLIDYMRFGISEKTLIEELTRVAPKLIQTPQALLGLLDAKLNLPSIQRTFFLETVFEPTPNRDSRVTLSSERDALGMPKVIVDWKLDDLDLERFASLESLVAQDLSDRGIIRPAPGEPWDVGTAQVLGCWHHMGTTRMSADARTGVVDPDCRVHDYGNLHIAGSSVFPTVGSDMPTMTIVALALRLVQTLRDVQATPITIASGTAVAA